VDAADYYRQVKMPFGTRGAAKLRSAVNNEVGRRLAEPVSGG